MSSWWWRHKIGNGWSYIPHGFEGESILLFKSWQGRFPPVAAWTWQAGGNDHYYYYQGRSWNKNDQTWKSEINSMARVVRIIPLVMTSNKKLRTEQGESMPKKCLSLLLLACTLMLMWGCAQPKLSPELKNAKVVMFNVPTCDWDDSQKRIRYILSQQNGVLKVEARYAKSEVTVYYDESRIGIQELIQVLNDKGFRVSGPPVVVR